MGTYVSFTKKGLFIMLAMILCFGFVCCVIAAISNSETNADTNAERLVFIKGLGYTVIDDKPDKKTVNLPVVFYDVYNNYNSLQQESNYDLSLYKGCKVTIYTYKINPPSNYTGECVVNIIAYKDKIIGGDVSSVELGGFMLPLKQVID